MATQDDSTGEGGGSKRMAKSPRYEETLYFLQTLGPSRPSESDSADYFAGFCPHHTSFNHAGAQSDHPYFSLFRYDTSGAYAHLKWRATEVIDATQAYPCTRQTPAEHSGQCGGDSCRVICRYGLPMVCARLLPCGLRARRGRPGSLWRYRRFTGGTYAQRTQLLRFLSACRPKRMFQACVYRRFGMG